MTLNVQDGTWSVDTTASTASFTVANLGFRTVTGTLPILKGTVMVTPGGEPSEVTATVDAKGFDTGNSRRDAHVRSSDFLHTDRYPELSFTSSSLKADSEGWQVAGFLSVRDKLTPMSLLVRVIRMGDDQAEIRASGRIDRRSAGITKGGRLLIGAYVNIDLEVVLRRNT
ncbi:YceI family protein [Streptomyces sp. NPDC085932]|uniref:YceI family protein n=1 Tax=Streptomyces sp. NPDC085932 TaxID=3365741 RepID=UPI0037D9202F